MIHIDKLRPTLRLHLQNAYLLRSARIWRRYLIPQIIYHNVALYISIVSDDKNLKAQRAFVQRANSEALNVNISGLTNVRSLCE